jgi:hypothetical protein
LDAPTEPSADAEVKNEIEIVCFSFVYFNFINSLKVVPQVGILELLRSNTKPKPTLLMVSFCFLKPFFQSDFITPKFVLPI